MILLDTHIWIWWVNEDQQLPLKQKHLLQQHVQTGLGVSIISCWEIAKLVEKGRMQFTISTKEWLDVALAYPGVRLLDLTPTIAIESTQLPGEFHQDPADQIIVATARVWQIPLMTLDSKILKYVHVKTI